MKLKFVLLTFIVSVIFSNGYAQTYKTPSDNLKEWVYIKTSTLNGSLVLDRPDYQSGVNYPFEVLDEVVSIEKGKNYNLNIVSKYLHAYGVWIDYNQDSAFTQDEQVVQYKHVSGTTIKEDFEFIVPNTAVVEEGKTRIRIRAADWGCEFNFDGCDTANMDPSGSKSSNSFDFYVDLQAHTISSDAKLRRLSPAISALSPVFDPDVFDYTVTLPYGTTATPAITAITADCNASVAITEAADVTSANIADRTTSVVVTAEDGVTELTYSVVFNVIETPNDDATLEELVVSHGALNPEFQSDIVTYSVGLSEGSTITPSVIVTKTDSNATYVIANAIDITSDDDGERTTVITVTAEDGTTQKAYSVLFNVADSTGRVVVAGNGTSYGYYTPFDSYYNYGWSAQVYTEAEIGITGDIKKIGFQPKTMPSGFATENQKVYLMSVDYDVFADASYIDPSVVGATLVFDGTIVWTGNDWHDLELATPFNYSGGNLLVLWENHDGSMNTGGLYFNSTYIDNTAKRDGNNSTFPTGVGSMQNSVSRANLKLVIASSTQNDDATLSDLSVELGNLEPDFTASTLAYSVLLPMGTTETPTTNAVTSNPNATFVVNDAADVTSADEADRTTTVVVTAEDGVTQKTYSILFNLATGNRDLVIFEKFSGIYCGACPNAVEYIHDVIANGGSVGVISYQTGGYSDPFYQCDDAAGMAGYYQSMISGYPTTIVDGFKVPAFNDPQQFQDYYNERKVTNPEFELDLDLTNNGDGNYTIDVDVEKVGTATTGTLRVIITETNIDQIWQGEEHLYDICRKMLPDYNGTAIDVSSTQSFSFDVELDPTWEKDYCSVIAYVQSEATDSEPREILGAIKIEFMEDEEENDVAIEDIVKLNGIETNGVTFPHLEEIDQVCGDVLVPTVRIRNSGTETLTSATIGYSVNGGDESEFAWTGSLEPQETAEIDLDGITVEWNDVENNLLVSVTNANGETDEDGWNDEKGLVFHGSPKIGTTPSIEFRTDEWPFLNSWKLMDSEGNVIQESENLESYTVYEHSFDLEEGCYKFAIYDETGNGFSNHAGEDGYFIFRDSENVELVNIVNFGYEWSLVFSTKTPDFIEEQQMNANNCKVFPNPSNGLFTIDAGFEIEYIEVFDLAGNKLMHELINKHAANIDTRGIAKGVYIMSVVGETHNSIQKIVIE